MILVLGATGTTGCEVARQLIAAGERPRLLVRSPDKARAFADGASEEHLRASGLAWTMLRPSSFMGAFQ